MLPRLASRLPRPADLSLTSHGELQFRAGRMRDGSPDRPNVVFLARPGRRAVVTPTLEELAGPEHGVVELPQRLMWNPDRRFDLDDRDERLWMYENLLREAIRADELCRWINGRVLARVWRDLNLPRGVRQAWETTHPALRRAA